MTSTKETKSNYEKGLHDWIEQEKNKEIKIEDNKRKGIISIWLVNKAWYNG